MLRRSVKGKERRENLKGECEERAWVETGNRKSFRTDLESLRNSSFGCNRLQLDLLSSNKHGNWMRSEKGGSKRKSVSEQVSSSRDGEGNRDRKSDGYHQAMLLTDALTSRSCQTQPRSFDRN